MLYTLHLSTTQTQNLLSDKSLIRQRHHHGYHGRLLGPIMGL